MAKRKLSHKAQGFVKDIAAGKTGTEAALNNYDTTSERVAAVIASENLRKPDIIEAIKSIAEQIPDELLVRKHLELLNKEEVIARNNMSTGQIEIVPTGQIDAHAVRSGLDMAYKLKGSYAAEKKEVVVEVNPELKAKIDSALDGILEGN